MFINWPPGQLAMVEGWFGPEREKLAVLWLHRRYGTLLPKYCHMKMSSDWELGGRDEFTT
jgi:hypothetical protein